MQKDGLWRGILASSAFHLLIGLLIIVPVITMDVRGMRESRRATGLDALGGGGGGTGGTGGVVEEIFYLNVAPSAGEEMLSTPTVAPPPQPEPPPEPEPVPEPEPIPPPAPETDTQTSAVPPSSSDTGTASSSAASAVSGSGGGTGNDGSAGSGPGSGGGVGAGIGTGRGSGVGPGTGAGTDSIHPPQLLTLGLPPLQPPAKVRPYTLIALFDVDEKGNTRLIGFNETPDGRFNRQLRQVLSDVRFRPATRLDGTPVRDTGRFVIQYP
jgi:protein TonB